MKTSIALVIGLMLSAGAFAQDQPHVHMMKPDHTPQVMDTGKQVRKDSLTSQTPAERKAVKQANRKKREARLNAMTPAQRAKVMARREQRKAAKKN